MARVTGLGGVFYKVKDPENTKRWYADVLGLPGEWGVVFRWRENRSEDAYSIVSPFPADSDYFDPAPASFMINLRVDDLDAFIKQLEARDVEVIGRQDEEYGKFAWILDPDGVKIELWQQIGPSPPIN